MCYNEVGCGAVSAVGNDAIIPRIPNQVRGFDCSETQNNAIKLTWEEPVSDGGSPVKCYVIKYQEVGTNSNVVQKLICEDMDHQRDEFGALIDTQYWFDTKMYNVPNLVNGRQYIFSIAAQNAAGPSKEVQTQCITCVAPSDPFLLMESTPDRTFDTLGIQWQHDKSNGALGVSYKVYYTHAHESLHTLPVESQPIDRPYYLIEGLTPGNTYRITVTASNMCGTSCHSKVLTLRAGNVPGQPCPVHVERQIDERFTCTWGSS